VGPVVDVSLVGSQEPTLDTLLKNGEPPPNEVTIQAAGSGSDGTWSFYKPGYFSAVLDAKGGRLFIQVAEDMEHEPRLTLENALRATASLLLPLHADGLMWHGASGIFQGQGLLFPGISTAGKTTLGLGFRDVTYLSDDVSLVDQCGDTPRLLPSPFFGIAGKKGAREVAPLAAICVLTEKAKKPPTRIEKIPVRQAPQFLMRHVVCWSPEPEVQGALLDRVIALATRIPIFSVSRHLSTSSDALFAQVLDVLAAKKVA
jgi:hypothetical protein